MTSYVQFNTSDGSLILMEVEKAEVTPERGVVKVGLQEKVQETVGTAVAVAQLTFEEAVERVVRYNAQAFIQSVRNMTTLPSEMEISFGLKATGELSNVAIGKIGGEANYSIKMVWKQLAENQQQNASVLKTTEQSPKV